MWGDGSMSCDLWGDGSMSCDLAPPIHATITPCLSSPFRPATDQRTVCSHSFKDSAALCGEDGMGRETGVVLRDKRDWGWDRGDEAGRHVT
jgi:hypothetical protein